jgi:hypothetical protein
MKELADAEAKLVVFEDLKAKFIDVQTQLTFARKAIADRDIWLAQAY